MWPQLREQRNDPAAAPFVVLRLRAGDTDAVLLPVHIIPSQGEYFGRAAQAAETRQGEDQTPLRIGAGVQDPLGLASADEVEALGIRANGRRDALEGILLDQPTALRRREELTRTAYRAPGCIVRPAGADHV
ncbi:MAG: hypothetical protein IH830_01955 [Planctomycetes bacterium]|nr:hypothetical protein [Planctomycetota bacterium]